MIFWKVTTKAARGQLRDGPISKFVLDRSNYICAKFVAFMTKKCTIGFNIPGKQSHYSTFSFWLGFRGKMTSEKLKVRKTLA